VLQLLHVISGTWLARLRIVRLSPGDVNAFRDKTRPVYTKWLEEIGADLVRSAEKVIESAK